MLAALTLGFLATTAAIASVTNTPRYEEPYGCSWQRCGNIHGVLMNCDPEEKGTTEDLVRVIQATNTGAVKYECGPGKGK